MDKKQAISFLCGVFQCDPARLADKPDELLNEAVEVINEFSQIVAELGLEDLGTAEIPQAPNEQEPAPNEGLGLDEEQDTGFIPG